MDTHKQSENRHDNYINYRKRMAWESAVGNACGVYGVFFPFSCMHNAGAEEL